MYIHLSSHYTRPSIYLSKPPLLVTDGGRANPVGRWLVTFAKRKRWSSGSTYSIQPLCLTCILRGNVRLESRSGADGSACFADTKMTMQNTTKPPTRTLQLWACWGLDAELGPIWTLFVFIYHSQTFSTKAYPCHVSIFNYLHFFKHIFCIDYRL